ncbi:MAG: hypothetical protein EHM23_14490 [Acidobacteria bacterium]|nr:MAG: hypothetical protein EHM23_14490 [Acidobacteriota bacterium]
MATRAMRLERGLFSSARTAWLVAFVYTIFLYSTLTLAFRLYVWMFDRYGKPFMSALMIWIYVPIGLALLAFLLFRLPRQLGRYVTFLMLGLAMAFCLDRITIPAKRFHFLEYAPLAVLVFDALRFHCRDRYHYVWSMVVVTLVGLGDEVIQGILPNRYFGINEVVTNAAAGFFALIFIAFVLGEENYPWPRRKKAPVSGSHQEEAESVSLPV